jgi:hypothetical protein
MLGAVAPESLAQVRLSVPEGCGSQAEFDNDIERLAGQFAAGVPPVSVSIERLAGDAYELLLTLGDEQRRLRDPECRVLWRSALLIVAAAAKQPSEAGAVAPAEAAGAARPAAIPAANVPAPAPPRAPLVPPAAAAAVTPAVRGASGTSPAPPPRAVRARRPARPRRAPPASAPASERAPLAAESALSPGLDADERGGAFDARNAGVRWGVAASAGVSGGVVPGLGPALELSVLLQRLPWATALSLRYWPERSEAVGERGVDVSAFGGRAVGLYRIAPALDGIAGLELMRLIGTGAPGVSGRNADAAWQLAPTLGVNWIVWDIHSLRLEVGVAGRVSLLRPRFVVVGFGDVYRAPALGADAIIRGVWLFR